MSTFVNGMASKTDDFWPVVSTRVPPDLAKTITRMAKAKSGRMSKVKVSDIVRAALMEYADRNSARAAA